MGNERESIVAEATGKAIIADFLHFDKKIDWRFEMHERLKHGKEKVIFWIGTIKLKEFNRTMDGGQIYFASGGEKLEADGEFRRDVDGACVEDSSILRYTYNFLHLKPELLKAKEDGHEYFSVWLKEVVRYNGERSVVTLHSAAKHAEEIVIRGVGSKVPWIMEEIYKWIRQKSKLINGDVVEVSIGYNPPYRWQK
jgi:hypothetical protein